MKTLRLSDCAFQTNRAIIAQGENMGGEPDSVSVEIIANTGTVQVQFLTGAPLALFHHPDRIDLIHAPAGGEFFQALTAGIAGDAVVLFNSATGADIRRILFFPGTPEDEIDEAIAAYCDVIGVDIWSTGWYKAGAIVIDTDSGAGGAASPVDSSDRSPAMREDD